MEGYFVRTLGMHRVYNSAFMVMLRDEDNAKYRSVIKNTLEFDPDIMKRYVNFMSNPDERTAVDQFGTGDKCFGVAVMMSTLPGLPMFGHGQIEGFTEKYGMEYRWPRYDESPDPWLIQRHDREIALLLKRRWLFAESSNFLLYDFFTAGGSVDENVFAYSNRNGSERALVVYNNRYGSTHGTIHYSAAYADKGSGGLRQQPLREGLGIGGDSATVIAFRDSLTGLEYLRRAPELLNNGLTLELHAYQSHVFLDWRELRSTAQYPWDRLSDHLNGRGVPNLDDALVGLELQPVHDALRRQLEPGIVRMFADLAEHPRAWAQGKNTQIDKERSEFSLEAWARCESFLRAAQAAYIARLPEADRPGVEAMPTDPSLLAPAFRERLRAAMRIPAIEALFPNPWTAAARRMLPSPSPQLTATAMWGPILAWSALELLAESIDIQQPERVALDLFDRLRLREPFAQSFTALGFEAEEGWRVAARIKVVLLTGAGVGKPEPAPAEPEPAEPVPAIQPESRAGKVGQGFSPDTVQTKTGGPSGPEVQAEKKPKLQEVSGHDFSRAENEPKVAGALAPEGTPSQESNAQPEPAADDEKVALAPALWRDPDVRWLTGVHEAEGHLYLVRESYEELLWWLMMPSLLRLAGETIPSRDEVKALSKTVEEALASAESVNYRIDELLGSAIAPVTEEPDQVAPEAESNTIEEGTAQSIEPAPETPQ
jgi:hypothetical protein